MESVRLSDGRLLAYELYGPADGVVVFHHHGGPGSRLASLDPTALEEAGVLLVVPDRPGFGRSDPSPTRPLSGWAGDLAELADSLEVDRVAVSGFSAGGPFALSVAASLGDRVGAVAVLAGAGELADPAVAGNLPAPYDSAVTLAREDPDALRSFLAGQAQPETILNTIIDGAPESDRAAYEDPTYVSELRAAFEEAFAQGPRAYADEFVALFSPWDFDVATITAPVAFWYGDEDPNPLHQPYMGERLAARIQRADVTIVPHAGAELGRHAVTGSILRALITDARS